MQQSERRSVHRLSVVFEISVIDSLGFVVEKKQIWCFFFKFDVFLSKRLGLFTPRCASIFTYQVCVEIEAQKG